MQLVPTCFCVNAWSLTSVASDTIEVLVNLKSFTLGSGIPSNPKPETHELNEVAVWNCFEYIVVFLPNSQFFFRYYHQLTFLLSVVVQRSWRATLSSAYLLLSFVPYFASEAASFHSGLSAEVETVVDEITFIYTTIGAVSVKICPQNFTNFQPRAPNSTAINASIF